MKKSKNLFTLFLITLFSFTAHVVFAQCGPICESLNLDVNGCSVTATVDVNLIDGPFVWTALDSKGNVIAVNNTGNGTANFSGFANCYEHEVCITYKMEPEGCRTTLCKSFNPDGCVNPGAIWPTGENVFEICNPTNSFSFSGDLDPGETFQFLGATPFCNGNIFVNVSQSYNTVTVSGYGIPGSVCAYQYEVTSAGCTEVYNFTIKIVEDCKFGPADDTNKLDDSSAESVMNSKALSFAPNPATDQVEVFFLTSQDAPASLELTDMNGKLVLTKTLLKNDNRTFIDVSELAGGMYVMLLRQNNQLIASKQLVVEH